MASETNSAALSQRRSGVALDQRANEHGTVQVTRAREAAADVQFFDDEALAAGACAADVLAQCEAGDHRAGGQRQQLVGQRLSGSVIECVGLGLPLQQQGGLGGVGQDQVCPAAEPRIRSMRAGVTVE